MLYTATLEKQWSSSTITLQESDWVEKSSDGSLFKPWRHCYRL